MEDVREGTPARGRRRGDRRVVRANDIVTDPSKEALARQGIAGEDARHCRAFAAFLAVMGSAPEDGRGRAQVPEPWRTYALGGPLPPDEAVAAVLGEHLVAA